jgi:protein phosphatase
VITIFSIIKYESAQDIGKRHEQQDSFAFSLTRWEGAEEPGILAVVCDGMGGMALGRESSLLATETFTHVFENAPPRLSVPEALFRSLLAANEAVREMASKAGFSGIAGTTLTAAVIERGLLYWTSVGDSRVYLFRGGSLKPLTEDHNVATRLEKLIEKGEMDPAEASAYWRPDALTSFIGIEVLEEYNLSKKPLPFEEGDMVLLCTDGLYNFMAEDEICEFLSSARRGPFNGTAQRIVNCLRQRGLPYQDNVTVLLLKPQP